jgi:hypothetical protein
MKKYLPHLIALVVFIAITLVYFSPLLDGKELRQSDVNNWKGMAQEILDYREKTGESTFWTNSMFGGMPAYQISAVYAANLIQYFDKVLTLGLPLPANYVFLFMIGFYFLLIVLKVDNTVAILGAVAFAFSSYFILYIVTGHNSKAHSIGYMAPVVAGIIMTYRGKYFLGSVIAAFFLSLQIFTNHLQITYYLMMMVVILVFTELYSAVKEKRVPAFIKASVFLGIGAVLAVLTNTTNLWATQEYGYYSTRGPSELSVNKENQTSGLDRDYITDWSYGVGESLTLIIPDFKGGASEPISKNNKDALKAVDNNMRQYISGFGSYFGSQPFTGGPLYIGAVVVLFFIVGCFVVKGPVKWWLLIATILSLMLSWGKNFMGFTNLFLDLLPGYDKFRAVTTILIIAEFTIPLLAILAINKMITESDFLKKYKTKFLYSMAAIAGITLLIAISPGTFTELYTSTEYDQVSQQVKGQQNSEQILESFFSALSTARKEIIVSDAIRSFMFMLVAGVFAWCFVLFRFKKEYFVYGLLVLVLLDLIPVDRRYLSSADYVKKSANVIPFPKTQADEIIHQDTTQSYRVLNVAANTFNDASTSYYHQSIGGYHGAKLKRYKELIDFNITGEVGLMRSVLQKPDSATERLLYMQPVTNMMNTKYIIYNPDAPPLRNNGALGNAWFVSAGMMVANSDSEIAAMKNFDPRMLVIYDQRYKDQLSGYTFSAPDSGDRINLTSYNPSHLTYQSNSSAARVAVFSEIHYDKGWNAYVDNKPAEYFRANYVLRAMLIPAGEHKIEFKFEPEVIGVGEKVSFASSLLLVLALAFVAFKEIKKQSN